MIRFPERFHASDSPVPVSPVIEPNYREEKRADIRPHAHGAEHRGKRREHFDFAALVKAFR